jgi:hypothetical protein
MKPRPTREYMNQKITITLRRQEWMIALFAARQMVNKRKRDIKNSPPFIPEPGKRNSNLEQIRKLNEAIRIIEEGVGASAYQTNDEV